MDSSLRAFMAQLKDAPSESLAGLVVGNESGDLDSIASALCYAYFLKDKALFLPVLNFFKESLSSRREALYLFEKVGISIEQLYFRDALEKCTLPILLVDHHRLAPDQKALFPFVEEVIDHHPGTFEPFPRLKHREIRQVGSTATLIAEKWGKSACPKETALLLLSAILLDTECLTHPIKTTAGDKAAAEKLKKEAEVSAPDQLYSLLRQLKEEGSAEELLLKDIKCYSEGKFLYAICSLPKALPFDREEIRLLLMEKGVHALFLWFPEKECKILELRCEDPLLRRALEMHLPFPIVKRGEGVTQFACSPDLSRKTLQPTLQFINAIPVQDLC